MLQEYPTQVQPRSSSTRDTQDQDGDSSNKLDAEAGRILIDLANQDTSLRNLNGNNNNNNNNTIEFILKFTFYYTTMCVYVYVNNR